MRSIEFLIFATILPTILGFFFESNVRPGWIMLILLGTAVLIILHLFLERYRWQMIPAYFLLTILLLITIGSITLNFPEQSTIWRVTGAILGLLFFIIAASLPILFPIFQLPASTGSYSIGTTLFNILAHFPDQTFTENPKNDRDIVVQAWYPAKAVKGRPSAYLANAPFLWDWLRLVSTHAYLDAPFSSKEISYPVLIFSHGGGFIAAQNTIQMQEMASHGYIIFSISHPCDSAVTVYPDGHTNGRSLFQAWRDMKPVLMDNNKAFVTTAALKHHNGGASLSLAEKKEVMQKVFNENTVALETINRRIADTNALIDYLEKLNNRRSNHLFSGKLDMDRLGILGHSNGGAVAVNIALNNSRIKAVINMDGYIFGDVFNASLQQPFMSMTKDGGQGRDDVVYAQANAKAYTVTIQGANHFNFMDIYLWMPLLNGKYLGSIDPQQAVEIINSYTLAFFDKHLKNKDVSLLDSPSPMFPEVLFNSRGS